MNFPPDMALALNFPRSKKSPVSEFQDNPSRFSRNRVKESNRDSPDSMEGLSAITALDMVSTSNRLEPNYPPEYVFRGFLGSLFGSFIVDKTTIKESGGYFRGF
jgi:hypothetical protein